jgi:hypothetical protein
VLAGQCRQQRQPDDATAFDQARLQLFEQRREALAPRWTNRSSP